MVGTVAFKIGLSAVSDEALTGSNIQLQLADEGKLRFEEERKLTHCKKLKRLVFVAADISLIGGIPSRTRRVLRASGSRPVKYVALTKRNQNEAKISSTIVEAEDAGLIEELLRVWSPEDTVIVNSNNAMKLFFPEIRKLMNKFPIVHFAAGQMAFHIQDSTLVGDLDYVRNYRATKIVALSDLDINVQRQFGIHGQVKILPPVDIRTENLFKYNGEIVLGYVGRIDFHAKGADRLIEIAASMRAARLPKLRVFTTDGSNSPDYRLFIERIESAGLIDQFEITLNCTDHEKIFGDLSVLLLPSRKEAFGNVVVEAFSFGVPVIAASYAPGPSETISHGETGFLLDEISGEKIVEVLRDLTLEDLSRMSESAFERHKNFTVAGHCASLEAVAEEALMEFDGENILPVLPELKIANQLETLKYQVRQLRKKRVTISREQVPLRASQLVCYEEYINSSDNIEAVDKLFASVGRSGSVSARELLVWAASGGAMTLSDLLLELDAFSFGSGEISDKSAYVCLDPDLALRLAKFLVTNPLSPDDVTKGFSLFRVLLTIHGASNLSPSIALTFLKAGLELQEYEVVKQLTDNLELPIQDRSDIVSDLRNRHGRRRDKIDSTFLVKFSDRFSVAGLEAVELSSIDGDKDATFFSRLYCPVSEKFDHASLVTVIFPVFFLDDVCINSLRSISNQSWSSIELLVVADRLQVDLDRLRLVIAELGPRVKLIESQAGIAANEALQQAKGDFIAFSFRETFCHPRKIESQVLPLIKDTFFVASRTFGLHVSSMLEYWKTRGSAQKLGISQLLFRRSDILDEIGYLCDDAEFGYTELALRIHAKFGSRVYDLEPKPLFISLVGENTCSFSRRELKRISENRARIRRCFEYWHTQILRGESSGYVDIDGRGDDSQYLTQPSSGCNAIIQRFDVVFAVDCYFSGEETLEVAGQIERLAAGSLNVGVLHLESFRTSPAIGESYAECILSCFHRGSAREILLCDEVAIDLVVFTNPSTLQFLSSESSRLSVTKAIVLAKSLPYSKTSGAGSYVVGVCRRNACEVFGVDPCWVPMNEVVRKSLVRFVPSNKISDQDLPNSVQLSEWRVPRGEACSENPTIGFAFEKIDILSLQDRLLNFLECVEGYDVNIRFFCEEHQLDYFRSLLQKSNLDLPVKGFHTDYRLFLANVDFLAYFGGEHYAHGVPEKVIGAMASGCVLILSLEHRSQLADTVIYMESEELPSSLFSMFKSRGDYLMQGEKAKEFAARKFGKDSFKNWLIDI